MAPSVAANAAGADGIKEPKVTQTNRVFSIMCGVEVSSAETPSRRLTDAKDFARWNSAVAAIEGQLREGGRLRVSVPGTGRTFTPTISVSTDFAMEERFFGRSLLARGARRPNPG